MQSASSSAMAVANWFLEKSWKDGQGYPVCDQLKLYKLVYLAHAWHLANGKGPLFEEDIEAWPHGPVVRDLYIQFKDAGREEIRRLGVNISERSDGEFELEIPKVRDASTVSFLNSVWDTYKKHTGIELSNATHRTGEPWSIVSHLQSVDEKPTIPNDLIEKVFKKKISEKSAANGSS